MMAIKFVILTILIYCDLTSSTHSSKTRNHFNVHKNEENELQYTPAPVQTNTCAQGASCVPYVQCPAHVHDGNQQLCTLSGARDGICCKTGQNHTGSLDLKRRSKLLSVSDESLRAALESGRAEVNEMLNKESHLFTSDENTIVREGTSSFGHFRNTKVSNTHDLSDILSSSRAALEIAFATKNIKNRNSVTNEQLELNMIRSNLQSFRPICLPQPICPVQPLAYRTYDGTCNNPLNGGYGATRTPFSRLMPPSYNDGIWIPRLSKLRGNPLPNPRLISSELFFDIDRPDNEHTVMVMQFGQFIAHDISRILDAKYPNGSGISCCNKDGSAELPAELQHYACMPITIPPLDHFYRRFNQGCMNFVRSVLAPNHGCSLGYAQQMNRVTHFIDGSAIYGTDQQTVDEIREYAGGRLRMFYDFGRELLPLSKDTSDCLTMERGSACFFSGDSRGNLMISLVVIHTLFAREHNRLASELTLLNPHWSDEIVFQEARRIVIAELQHITYSQWLPEIIGYNTMQEFHLDVSQSGYSRDYDPTIDPSVTNEFSTAAFRFGHSIVDGKLKVYGPKKMDEIIDIPEVMFYPSRMRRTEFYDEILSTLTTEKMQTADTSVTEGLSKYMFRAGKPFGMDLISMNIQRGRDHGIRSYNDYRELVGLHRYLNFDYYDNEIKHSLQKVYESVDDIDLFVGGLIETPAPRNVVGHTFREIIADQFSRLRRGDRFFYDLDSDINPSYFTAAQLAEIKRVSLARIICDNSDKILLARQAINSFRIPGLPGNELKDCNSPEIPRINLLHWRDL